MFSLLRLLNFAIPFRLGEVITLGILKRRGLAPTIAETAPLWMALRVMDVVALAILFAVCACLGIPGEHVGRLTVALAVGAISATGLLLAAGLFVWRVRLEQWAWLSKRLADARSGFKRLSNFKSLIVAWLIALAIWATMSILVTTAQLAFGTPLPFATCALIAVGILAVSVLPIHGPLGIGSVDTALAGMMILAGLSTEPAVAITLCVRMLLVGCVLIDGLIGWVLLHAFPARQLYVGEEPT